MVVLILITPIATPSSVMSEAVTNVITNSKNLPMTLTLNGDKLSKTAKSSQLMPYPLKPKERLNGLTKWMQDRIIRTCIREDVKEINHGQRVLNGELDRYNHKQVHSTTEEIPYLRFQNAKEQNKSLFREFKVPPPYLTLKDIFCFRTSRIVDTYCKITIKNLSLRLKDAEPRQSIDIRAYALDDRLVELRFWHHGRFLESHRVKMADLGLSTFYL